MGRRDRACRSVHRPGCLLRWRMLTNPADVIDDADTATRARNSWDEIQTAYRDASVRGRDTYAAIEEEHRKAATRAAESWAAIAAAAERR